MIATKVGDATGAHGIDVSRKHILKAVEGSLRRLQTDYIDLYYTQYDDQVTPVEETLSTYEALIKAGRVRYIAVSNISPERLTQSFIASERSACPNMLPYSRIII